MNNIAKAFGDPNPVISMTHMTTFYNQDTVTTQALKSEIHNNCATLDESQTDLLKTVVQFLNQINSPFYTNNHNFITIVAKGLADQINSKFHIG